MNTMNRAVAFGTAIMLLAGCSLISGGVSATFDGEWRLQAGTHQGQPVPIVLGSQPTLRVDGTKVGGSAACNSYGGKLQIDGTKIRITELIQTEMACLDDRLMASEAAYLAALSAVSGSSRTANTLVLSGPQVELRYDLVKPAADADLLGTVWLLDSLINGDAVSSTVGDPATLQLNADGTFSASTGCREITGRYTITGNEVRVTIDPYDLVGCAEPIGAQDVHVLGVLNDGFGVQIDGASLTLTSGARGLGYRVSS